MSNSITATDAASRQPQSADASAQPMDAPLGSPASQVASPADRLSPVIKAAYALGGTTDIFGHWLYNGLKDPVFAMTADVVDFDELSSGQRRESAYTATFSWVMKVGMMLSMLSGGPLLELTGFDAKLGGNQTPEAILGIRLSFAGIPVAALMIALILIRFYPLDTERMRIILRDLEARRGAV